MSPCINQPLDHKISTVSSLSNQQALLQAVITPIILACVLIFNISEPICENAIWDERETNKMMEYLQDNAALVGDGGNFKYSTYQAAATYIAPYHRSNQDSQACQGKV